MDPVVNKDSANKSELEIQMQEARDEISRLRAELSDAECENMKLKEDIQKSAHANNVDKYFLRCKYTKDTDKLSNPREDREPENIYGSYIPSRTMVSFSIGWIIGSLMYMFINMSRRS